MQQQLIQQTIEIIPATMNEVLPKLTHVLAQPNINQKALDSIVKSIFYGLWNFDKMINQHNLSTTIAEMLSKLPKKNAFMFLQAMLVFLKDKWNLIDHHRINKFMQLVRYLIRQALKISQKKTDEVLLQTIYINLTFKSGIADHITEIYFQSACEVFLPKPQSNQTESEPLPWSKLQIFERILQLQDTLEQFHSFIIEKIYQKYKSHVISHMLAHAENPELALQKIDEFNKHILQLAKQEQKDSNRKSLYTLIGFMKSDHDLFRSYQTEKIEKLREQREKKNKKISKGKKNQIKQAKKNNKQKSKSKRKGKIISRSRFEFDAREQLQKAME